MCWLLRANKNTTSAIPWLRQFQLPAFSTTQHDTFLLFVIPFEYEATVPSNTPLASKLKSLSSTPALFPRSYSLHLFLSLSPPQNTQSCSIAPAFLGGNTNRGSSTHLIHNKCVYAACGGRNVHCLLDRGGRWPLWMCCPQLFKSFLFFPTDTHTKVNVRVCVVRENKQQNTQRNLCRKRWLTMNQSKFGFETYALYLFLETRLCTGCHIQTSVEVSHFSVLQ